MLWTILLFVLTFTLSLALFGAIVVLLPPRYFADAGAMRFWADKPPWMRWVGLIGKNLLGLLVIALGVLLSLPGIPGQGILTILIGVLLLDIPGKRRLIRWLLRRPRLLRPLNRFRGWFGRQPLLIKVGK
jgi:hypothetical protein